MFKDVARSDTYPEAGNVSSPGRLRKFLLEMFEITDETDIADLGADLSPVTPLTIGDLKILMSAVASEIEDFKRRERDRAPAHLAREEADA